MRITRKTLLRVAEQKVLKETSATHDIAAVYLIGSVQSDDDPLLGGTTDIDLVFVHTQPPRQTREALSVSPDIHLDIVHRQVSDYEPARALRDNPWLGPEIYAPQLLYESGHFFEFTQAAVRADFDAPRHRLKRSRNLYQHGREIWMDLQFAADGNDPNLIARYLKAVMHAANALTALDDGPPLADRRFVTGFMSRAAALGQARFIPDLLALLHGGAPPESAVIHNWLGAWQDAFRAAVLRAAPYPRLHQAREGYYLRGMEALLQGDAPYAALWPLLRTWTQAVLGLGADSPLRAGWQNAINALHLGGEAFEMRLAALDAFLDALDELLEAYAQEYGLS